MIKFATAMASPAFGAGGGGHKTKRVIFTG